MKQNQKWLSMLFAFVLLVSTLMSPISTYAESSDSDDNVEVKQDDDKNDKEQATESEEEKENSTVEETSNSNEESKEEKASSEKNERAPPEEEQDSESSESVTVDVRVETDEETLVPTTEIEVKSFELMEYIDNDNNGNSEFPDSPRAIHAIIQALETVEGLDLKDDQQFGLGYNGNYISDINGLGEFSHPLGMDGWMYFIDNEYVDRGVLEREIENGDSIVLYYVVNYGDNTFSWFDDENYTVETGEELDLTLTGVNMDVVDPVEGASLLIDEEEYEQENKTVLTDEDGKVTVVFNEPGTYHLSASRNNDNGDRNIVRSYAKVEVTGKSIETDENNSNKLIEEVLSDIEKLPNVSEVTLEDGSQVEKVRTAFNDLNEEQQSQVNNTDKLNELEKKLESLNEEIDLVQSKINELPDSSELDLNDEDSLIEVRNLYNDLTEEQQKHVTNLEKLESLEEKLEELKAEDSNAVNLDKSIDKAAGYILSKGVTSEWEAIGLARAGKEVPESYRERFYTTVETQVDNALETGRIKITDIERLTIAAAAIGEDPTDINGTNLIDLIYNSPEHLSGADTMTMQGNNGPIFALIALDTKDYKEPFDAEWNREKLIEELLNNQNDDGSWALNSALSNPSIDITAMAIIGLAPYKDQPEVKAALDKTVKYLSENQGDEGGFTESFVGGTSSEASAQAIIGLSAYGIDATDDMFTKKDNDLLGHLLSYQNDDGGFAHLLNTGTNDMATEQGIQGIVAYQLFLNDKGKLYDFSNVDEQNNEKAQKVEAIIDALPDKDNFSLDHKDELSSAIKAFEELTEAQQNLVTNSNKLDELLKKQNGLEEEQGKVLKEELDKKIKEAKDVNVSNKTDDSVKVLKDAISKAEKVSEDNSATKEEVDSAIKSIENAIKQLDDKPREEVDKSKLSQKISEAKQIDTKGKTTSSIENLDTAIGAAEWVIATGDIRQKEIDAQLENLQDAINNLEDIDKSELTIVLNKAEKQNTKGKTDESINQLKEAIKAGKKVNDNKSATEEDVEEVIERINEAIDNLEKVDKSELETIIEEAEHYDTKGKTDASIEKFKKAIQSGKKVFESTNSSEKDVKEAIEKINISIEKLENVDKTKLNETIEKAELKQKGKTPETIDELQPVKNEAKKILEDKKASEKEVNSVIDKLEKSISNLEPRIKKVKEDVEAEVEAGTKVKVSNKKTSKSASIKLPETLKEGTKIKVNLVDENEEENDHDTDGGTDQEDTSKDKKIKQAGVIVDVELTIPESSENDEEPDYEYELTLDVNEEETEKVGIFYYNEDTKEWEYVNGSKRSGDEVSATVTHFSKYGVFAIDSTTLKKLIEDAENKDLTNYTDATKEALEKAIQNGNNLLESDEYTPAQMDKAVEELEEVLNNLEIAIYKVDLSNKIDEAANMDTSTKTDETKLNLQVAIQAAKQVNESESVTQDEVDKALEVLQLAIDELADKANKNKLSETIEKAENINTKNTTKSSKKAFEKSLKQAKQVNDNASATQEEIDEAVKELNKNIKGLKDEEKPSEEQESKNPKNPKQDEPSLEELVEELNVSKYDQYTQRSLDRLKDAIAHAESVLNSENATDDEIQEAMDQLDDAYNALVLKDDDDESNKNHFLPSTATSFYTIMLIGATLIGLALLMMVYRKKKVNS